MSKVIVRISGGIGNQLFTYAAVRRLALVNGAELVLDSCSGFAYDRQYQRKYHLDHFEIPCRKATLSERLEPFSRVRRQFLRRINRARPFQKRSYLRQDGIDFDTRLLDRRIDGTVYIEGYWQSERYFDDVKDVIRGDLCIRPPADTTNRDLSQKILNHNAVALHMRFFDDPQAEKNSDNAPGDYYQRAIAEMDGIAPGAHYYIFSDRPDSASQRLTLNSERYTLVDHNKGDASAYADLWLMAQCQHFIIANSTFSWWGAWLGEKEGTVVIAPGFEKRHGKSSWGFEGLLPERWIKL